ncbi:MAG TPA: 16S rRNA (cytosine(1402)-N(4))-methyltransferase RsmH [Clostridia bacterium]|nr:16S rRNA (cytosine(1402)-N(4))-methyltransferase RsmH [Clostridia bacterium]
MSEQFSHIPVLLNETLEYLAPERGGTFIDGTLGGGGHAEAVLSRLLQTGRLIGIDRDWEAVRAAGERLAVYGSRFTALHGNFFDMKTLLSGVGVHEVNGILLDLGVSSHQLDTQERGFSYKTDAPLDMRMDQSAAFSARDIINKYPEAELTRIFFAYGEERFSKRIAERICNIREQSPIETTLQLAQIVRDAIPAKYRNEPQHPARRTFQALRIEVNGELSGLDRAVEEACDLLQKGGRLCIITFHSLEDRIVKQAFRRFENPCTCPPSAPICICGKEPKAKILTKKPLTASLEEETRNSRSTSAKLRCIEKI